MASGDKRKASESPEVDPPHSRLRRRGSLPDLQEIADLKKTSWADVMKKGFLDPEIMKDIAPIITRQLGPSVEQTIKSTIEGTLATVISTAVNEALNKFKTDVMDPLIKQKDDEIASLKSQIKDKNERVKGLEKEVGLLNKGLNHLEQNGRRNN